jgi:hypothetical protein
LSIPAVADKILLDNSAVLMYNNPNKQGRFDVSERPFVFLWNEEYYERRFYQNSLRNA